MKLLLVLAVGCLTVSASIFAEDDSRIHGENGWYVPRENETFFWIDKEKAEAYREPVENYKIFDWLIPSVKFYLYTQANPTRGQNIEAKVKSILASNFNPNHPTRIIIHGAWEGHLSKWIQNVRDSLLRSDQYNVIVVDWWQARTPYFISAAKAVPKTGKTVAEFIDYLGQTHSIPFQLLHVIGYGLGAHVAGYAGKGLKTGQIHAIIGLDPSLALFSYNDPTTRLADTDAFYVETIQSSCGILGFKKPIGTASFYPNGGIKQPGCLTSACSHRRSTVYYAESLARNDFAAIRCNTYEDAIAGNCGSVFSSVRMGGDKIIFLVSGVFNVPVHEKPPYGVLT